MPADITVAHVLLETGRGSFRRRTVTAASRQQQRNLLPRRYGRASLGCERSLASQQHGTGRTIGAAMGSARRVDHAIVHGREMTGAVCAHLEPDRLSQSAAVLSGPSGIGSQFTLMEDDRRGRLDDFRGHILYARRERGYRQAVLGRTRPHSATGEEREREI